MNTFESVLLMLLVVDALALIILVMLQQGKGADVGAAFGSGSSNTMFGAGGSASFLTKITVWLAIGFFAIAFGLAYFAQVRADEIDTLGMPSAESGVPAALSADPLEPELPALDAAPQDAEAAAPIDLPELTPEAEGVDSDIPEV